jgi:hypothetical protein
MQIYLMPNILEPHTWIAALTALSTAHISPTYRHGILCCGSYSSETVGTVSEIYCKVDRNSNRVIRLLHARGSVPGGLHFRRIISDRPVLV